MPTPEHASISEFPFGMPISVLLAPAPSCQDPHSHKHQTVQRQGSSGIISCLSASMSGPLPSTGSGRTLTTLWRIIGGSLVMVYIKMYPDLKGDQILIIPAPVFQCYSERMYRDLTLPAASPTSQ